MKLRNPHIRSIIIALAVIVITAVSNEAVAQRRINPVTPPKPGVEQKKKTEEQDRSRVAERKDAQGNVVLVDTVSGQEFVDTLGIIPPVGNIYPLWHAVTVGVNIADPVLRALGQQYGGGEVWGELSLHNRFKPVVEFGLSAASIKPDGSNYRFHSPLAPYFRLGMNYNVFYNSNPAYQLLVGLRYGLSPFSWRIEDVVPPANGYWGDTAPVEFPDQHSVAGYWEGVLSIKVKIVGPLSLGWAVKFHSMIHGGNTPLGQAMYVPGYGKRSNALTVGFSVMYTLPLNRSVNQNVSSVKE